MQHSSEKLSRAIYLWDQIERAKRFALLTTDANERHVMRVWRMTISTDSTTCVIGGNGDRRQPDRCRCRDKRAGRDRTACNFPGQATETQRFLRISGS